MDNTPWLLACNRIPNFGPRTIARCQKIWPNLADLFDASIAQLTAVGLTDSVIAAITTFDFKTIEADLAWMTVPNQQVLTLGSESYPKLLTEIPDPPPVLYVKGRLDCFAQPTVGIVGTRNPSATGAETAKHFAKELAQMGLTIVSGLALGIDAQAHRGCLAAEGKTVAVMGTGMNAIYPRQHRSLAEQISEQGLLLSEFPLDSPPMARHFPQRNRLISGLSLAVLVIEAALRSGSLITARYAIEQNRDVLAIPGSIYHTQAKGCHRLLQQGACLITSVEDVVDAMNLTEQPFIKNLSIIPEICNNKGLLQSIGFELTTIDQIMERSGFSIDTLLSKLVELDLQGWIQVVPGGYMRCR